MTSHTEQEVAAFLEGLVPEVARLTKSMYEGYWRATTGGGDEAGAAYGRLRQELMGLYSDPGQFARLKTWKSSGEVRDPLLARQLDLVHNEFLGNQAPPETIAELVRRETELESIFTYFRAEYQGRRASANGIAQVLQDETRSDLRREAWEASKRVGRQVAPLLLELVELRNQVARDLGFSNYYEMCLVQQEIDPTELFGLLGDLEQRTALPFARAKAQLDRELARRFGVAPSEVRPWHYADPFFQEAPASAEVDLDAYFAGKDIPSLVCDYYRDLGLDVTDIIARSDLYEREGKSQHGYCVDIDREGDVRVLCNLRANEKWAGVLLHEVGHAVYVSYTDPDLPFLLRTEAHTSSSEAVAMMLGALTRNATWLEAYAGVPRAEAVAAAAGVRAQLVLAKLITIRWSLVMVYFERAMYEDPRQDLSRLWWELVQKLQLVTPPEGRNEPDYATKFVLSTAPVYYQNYILGELTAAQMRAALARATGWQGEDGRGSAGSVGDPAAALSCNPAAGRYLVERIFRYGSRGPWNELLRQATGEPLTPGYFVDQFLGS
ncbi:MAG: M2 family metallopeptidase [Symbiobacteriia bacterium]